MLPVLVVLLTACGGGSSSAEAEPRTTPPTSAGSSPPASDAGRDDGSGEGPATTQPPDDSTFPGAVALSSWLTFDGLEVRAIGYRRAGVASGGADRIDVVTVEECATTSTDAVAHHTWHLVDAAGKTLGVAGAKIVHRVPTEDIPRELAPGGCRQTQLAIAVAESAVAAAVKDGPAATWLLTQ